MAHNIIFLLKRLTIDQWSAIDAQYKLQKGYKVILSLIVITILLVIQRYYGQPKNFTELFGDAVSNFPFPRIWSRLYATSMYLLLYMLIPYLYIRLVLHERIQEHGFTLKGAGKYIRLYFIMILAVLPVIVIASFTEGFSRHYPLYADAGSSWWDLLIWETAYNLHFVALEFFFRGFMLFALVRYFGYYAIFIMVIPYTMVHFGKPIAETIGSILAGIALGTLSLRTRSIFGGVFIHITAAIGMDIMALLQKGLLQNLFR